eukprot:COSAG02_NODE_561_length_20308_cov_42.799495_22_plen_32_part_01
MELTLRFLETGIAQPLCNPSNAAIPPLPFHIY